MLATGAALSCWAVTTFKHASMQDILTEEEARLPDNLAGLPALSQHLTTL